MRDAYDVIIIGAGAAGLAAVRRLMAAQIDVIVLEASDHIGGRARTIDGGGYPVDLGCGWLHSADQNPWVAIAEQLGLTIDRSPPPWTKRSFGQLFTADEQKAYRAASAALEDRVAAVPAEGPDVAAADLLAPGERWNALLNAVSTYYNGVELKDVSAQDFNNYIDTDVNWRVQEGYGKLVSMYGRDAPVVVECPVPSVNWSGEGVRATTARGDISARAAIVAVPPTPIANDRLRFYPPLPEKVQAAGVLPLGVVEKVFLSFSGAKALPVDGHFFASIDRTDTGSYHLRPFGRPLIECFFAGELARDLDHQGAGAFVEFAKQELASLMGEGVRAQLAPVAQSAWLANPHIGGAYSHAKPGHVAARAVLAAPVAERLFFAGEACSPDSFSTAHGAYQTGIAAAEALLRTPAFAPR